MVEDTVSESVKVDKLSRSVEGRKASQELLNLQLSETASATFVLDALGGDNDAAVVVMTLQNENGLRLFGTPHITLYKDSVSSANKLPEAVLNTYLIGSWLDWGDSDNYNLKCKTYIRNLGGGSVTIHFRGNWRYIVESGS